MFTLRNIVVAVFAVAILGIGINVFAQGNWGWGHGSGYHGDHSSYMHHAGGSGNYAGDEAGNAEPKQIERGRNSFSRDTREIRESMLEKQRDLQKELGEGDPVSNSLQPKKLQPKHLAGFPR